MISNSIVASENLVRNSGFKSANGSLPQDWQIAGPVASRIPLVEIDLEVYKSGQQSLKMYGNGVDYCMGKVIQKVSVSEGTTYQFSALITVKGVESIHKNIVIKLVWYNGESRIGMTYAHKIVEEEGSWSTISKIAKALPEATHVEIHLEFRWSAQGTVWWDEISLAPTTPLSSRVITVGTMYANPKWPRTIKQNLELFGKLLDEAGAKGCDIVCLPEGWAVYGVPDRNAKNEANKLHGVANDLLEQKAEHYSMYIVGSLFIWEEDNLFNVAVLYDRDGKLSGLYKKVHLPNAEAESGFVPGEEFPVYETDFGTIGMQICWDNVYPEHARMLALQGAEIIFFPIWSDTRGWDKKTPYTEQPIGDLIARARAIDNGVYIVQAIYGGHSQIIDPGGQVLAESTDSTTKLITADIDLDYNPPWKWLGAPGRGEWKSVWRKDRRPEMYKKLVTHP